MAGAGERFIQGSLDVGGGISRGLLKKLLTDYERQKEEEDRAQKQKAFELNRTLTGAQADYYNARTNQMGGPTGQLDDVVSKYLVERFQSDPDFADLYIRRKVLGEKQEKPEKPTFSFEDVIKIRQQAEDDARAIRNRQTGQDLDYLQQERNKSAQEKAAGKGIILNSEQLPYPVSEPPAYTDIANLADTLQYEQLGIPTELIGSVGRSPFNIMNLLTTGNAPEGKEGNEYSRKADELVKQGKMTPQEREEYRRETGY